MDQNTYPLPHAQTAFAYADDQAVIVMADSGQVTVLNEVATRVWQLADGTHSVAFIIAVIHEEFEAEPEQIRSDVEGFLQQLLEINAIVLQDTPGKP